MISSVDILEWPTGRLDLSEGTQVMGILNVTPDSFSDGGQYARIDQAVAHGLDMVTQGATVIDVGPESSRPGSQPVPRVEQIRRSVPVIEALAARTEAVISIDTPDVAVAAAALDAGANLLNDITAGAHEAMLTLAAERQVPIVLMHMQGAPKTMQQEPVYGDVVTEVRDFLLARARRAEALGVPSERIILDPGIGFGKTLDHNLALLRHLEVLMEPGYPVLLGTSRKRMLGELTGRAIPSERVYGTVATTAWAVQQGVSLVRVHDVAATVDVVKVTQAICKKEKDGCVSSYKI